MYTERGVHKGQWRQFVIVIFSWLIDILIVNELDSRWIYSNPIISFCLSFLTGNVIHVITSGIARHLGDVCSRIVIIVKYQLFSCLCFSHSVNEVVITSLHLYI